MTQASGCYSVNHNILFVRQFLWGIWEIILFFLADVKTLTRTINKQVFFFSSVLHCVNLVVHSNLINGVRLNSRWHQSQIPKQWENNKTENIISIHKSICMVRVMEHFKSYDFPGKVSKNHTFENYSEQLFGILPCWQNEKCRVNSLRVIHHSWRSKGRMFSKASEWHILLNKNMVMKKAKRKLPNSLRKQSQSIFFKK